MASQSKEDWKARIAPHLSTSLQTVSERITQTESVQRWLQKASMEAAQGLGETSGIQGQMRGYMRMMQSLEAELPDLVTAVHELTDGSGQVDLHWRPLQPNFSRLYIDFDRDYKVKVFVRLSDCTVESAREALEPVANALPKGDPFPNRPNKVTGLVAHEGRAVGVRFKTHLRDDGSGTYHSVTLLPPDGDAVENLDVTDGARRLLQLLCREPSASP